MNRDHRAKDLAHGGRAREERGGVPVDADAEEDQIQARHAAAAAIPERLTITLPVINTAARVFVLAAGPEKAKVVKAVLSEKSLVPAGMVSPMDGELWWFVDEAAAALLPR